MVTEAQLTEAQRYARDHVWRILRNKSEDEIDDVLQTAAFKAIKFQDQFNNKSQFKTYFTRIAINEALMLLRARRRDLWFEDIDTQIKDVRIYEPPDPQPSPERQAILTEAKEKIIRTVRQMSPTVLKGFLGLIWGDVANTDTKKARRHRARVILRHALRGLRA